jgi:hypothetical protein
MKTAQPAHAADLASPSQCHCPSHPEVQFASEGMLRLGVFAGMPLEDP